MGLTMTLKRSVLGVLSAVLFACLAGCADDPEQTEVQPTADPTLPAEGAPERTLLDKRPLAEQQLVDVSVAGRGLTKARNPVEVAPTANGN
jgi:hypothetical protein